jgi:hypothetical protein
MNKEYAQTVQLLLAVAPDVFHTSVSAMKGGTAINLFVQDMPRLSVDIDLVWPTSRRPLQPTNWYPYCTHLSFMGASWSRHVKFKLKI